MIYFVGVSILFKFGPSAGVFFWLFAFSVLSAILLNVKAVVIATVINIITIVSAGLLKNQGIIKWNHWVSFDLINWFATCLSFLFINALVVVAVIILMRGLEIILAHEKKIKETLKKEKIHLVKMNKKIKLEKNERKKVEHNYIESEQKYYHTMDAALVGIYVIQDMVFSYVNPEMARMFGYVPDDMIDKMSPPDLLVPEEREIVRENLKRRAKGEEGKPYEVNCLRKDGSKFTALVWGKVITYKDRPASVGTLFDISERKKLELQLLHTQKIDAIGTLAGGIAHDFNNILTAIILYTELSMQRLPEENRSKNDMNQVLKSAHRAKDLVSQILSFSRKGDGYGEIIKISDVITESIKMIRSVIPASIEMIADIRSDSGRIKANQTHINQIMMNICINASQAMYAQQGVLTIKLDEVVIKKKQISSLNRGKYACLTISDTGYGMEKDVLEKIFDPFFTTKKTGEGTGMGLSIVYGIVGGYKGSITVDSKPEIGSTFKIYLPLLKDYKEGSENKDNESFARGTESILLIDDEKDVVDVGGQILTHLGYKVVIQTNSRKGLEIFKKNPEKFDLIITDMTMPHKNGDDLAKEALVICPEIPIIICTGFSDVINEKKSKALGIRAFLRKPYTIKEISDLVNKILH